MSGPRVELDLSIRNLPSRVERFIDGDSPQILRDEFFYHLTRQELVGIGNLLGCNQSPTRLIERAQIEHHAILTNQVLAGNNQYKAALPEAAQRGLVNPNATTFDKLWYSEVYSNK